MIGAFQAGVLYGDWTPSILFASGEPGAWYDPSDLSTLFQDSAATTPVTSVDQYVGKILDKSGRGNHASQSTSGKRPQLKLVNGRYCLLFSSTNQFYISTGNFDMSGTDEVFACVGVTKTSASSAFSVFEHGDGLNSNRVFGIVGQTSGDSYRFGSGGSAWATATSGSVFSAPVTKVLSGLGKISTDQCILRSNGSQIVSSSTDQGTGNYGNVPLYIGSRTGSSLFLNGNIYGLIIRGGSIATNAIDLAESWMNRKTGAY